MEKIGNGWRKPVRITGIVFLCYSYFLFISTLLMTLAVNLKGQEALVVKDLLVSVIFIIPFGYFFLPVGWLGLLLLWAGIKGQGQGRIVQLLFWVSMVLCSLGIAGLVIAR